MAQPKGRLAAVTTACLGLATLILAVLSDRDPLLDWWESHKLEEGRLLIRRAADYLHRRFQQQEIERFRKETPNGRVIELSNTDHHCFIQREPPSL